MPHELSGPKLGARVTAVFQYQIKDRKKKSGRTAWLTMVSPDASIQDAQRLLRGKFGENLLHVRKMGEDG